MGARRLSEEEFLQEKATLWAVFPPAADVPAAVHGVEAAVAEEQTAAEVPGAEAPPPPPHIWRR